MLPLAVVADLVRVGGSVVGRGRRGDGVAAHVVGVDFLLPCRRSLGDGLGSGGQQQAGDERQNHGYRIMFFVMIL